LIDGLCVPGIWATYFPLERQWILTLKLILMEIWRFFKTRKGINVMKGQNLVKSLFHIEIIAVNANQISTVNPQITHLSQSRPLDVVLVLLQRPKYSPLFGVLVCGTGFGCCNVRLFSIQFLCRTAHRTSPGRGKYVL
jgi:hypothetical protein